MKNIPGIGFVLLTWVVLLLVWLLLAMDTAKSHETARGTPFPPECCSGRDCEAVTRSQIDFQPNGDWYVRLSRGTVFVPADFPRRWFAEFGLFICAGKALTGEMFLYCVLTQPGA